MITLYESPLLFPDNAKKTSENSAMKFAIVQCVYIELKVANVSVDNYYSARLLKYIYFI